MQYARAVAALLVVVFHLKPQLERMGASAAWLNGFTGGVDVFFVVSGLIMWITTRGRPMSPGEFLRRRLTRIVPLYWLATSFMVAILVAAPKLLQTSRFDAPHILASYLFVPWRHPVTGLVEPVLFPGWTLNYEMAFYALFALALLIGAVGRRLWFVCGALAAVTAAGFLPAAAATDMTGFYANSIVLEFAFGVLIGEAYARSPSLPGSGRAVGALAVISGLVLLVVLLGAAPQWPRVVVGGLPAALAVAGVLLIEKSGGFPRLALPLALGDASYSLYLTHTMALSAFGQGWRKLPFAGDGLLSMALFPPLAILGCCGIGWLCFRFVEAPLIDLFRRRRA